MANRDAQVADILGSATFNLPNEHGSVSPRPGIPDGSNGASPRPIEGTNPSSSESDRNPSDNRTRVINPSHATSTPNPASGTTSGGNRDRSGTSRGNPRARSGGRATSPQATENLEKLLFSIHFMLAAKTEISELAITPEAAHELASAIATVNKLYGKSVISDGTYAWINLMVAAFGTYGPMAVAVYRRSITAEDGGPINPGTPEVIPPQGKPQ